MLDLTFVNRTVHEVNRISSNEMLVSQLWVALLAPLDSSNLTQAHQNNDAYAPTTDERAPSKRISIGLPVIPSVKGIALFLCSPKLVRTLQTVTL
jgi:6-phosphogluconolactonase/glucosamine-6-phosphate isomerase/deaminase